MKYFEVRDRMTFIPCFAFEITGSCYLERSVGFRDRVIMFGRLEGGKCYFSPFDWGDRTYHTAHMHITNHWDELNDGDVIDVEFILKETDSPKQSQRFG